MVKPYVFEKPLGMRDILPELLRKQRFLESVLRSCINKWGYEEIATPSLEYFDTVGAASVTVTDHMFKLLDKQGHTVILRPELTAPIARVVSSLYKDVPYPIRLFYQANVFRAQEKEAGRNAEFFQTGVELIGDASVDADAEAIALAISCLHEAGVPTFKIAVGHIDIVMGLLEECVREEEVRSQFCRFLHQSDYVGYRQLVMEYTDDADVIDKLLAILRLRGGRGKIDEARQLITNPKSQNAIDTVASLWGALEAYGVTEHVLLDFNLIGRFDYYTGIVFEGYAADLGSPLLSGGRYDNLLERFGRPAAATGFALEMDRLMTIPTSYHEVRTEQIVILYKAEYREEALQLAQQKRKEQQVVVTGPWTDETEKAFASLDNSKLIRLGET
ncbi:ATP phosphoribosyltransferase regulatory subunit [Brevibacillus daliensis]|uniref:ATP phosphoribosyltransferase regulatory subunit n=1 Tax=Brevibacillus daliensis TaxID=2892995 RepID=UPI001E567E49|nr:ATP phosphoribosyltransferase regulatory subunit [Brevibacillus daliensis]